MTASPTPSSKLTVLTRDTPGNRLWKTPLAKMGLHIYELPCIKTVPTQPDTKSLHILEHLTDYRWLVFTSASAVRYFAQLLSLSKLDNHTLATLPIAAIGRQTADAITARGLIVSFTPSRADALSLASHLPAIKGHRVLFIQTTLAGPKSQQILGRRGASVEILPVYTTELLTDPIPAYDKLISSGSVAQVIFASPSAVRAYTARLDHSQQALAKAILAIAIGQTTAAELAQENFENVKTADSANVEAIMKLIS